MTNLITNNEIISEIENYPNPNYIWIEIWQNNQYEIQLVITVNHEEMCHLGGHKVLRVGSLFTDEEEIETIKDRGREIKKLLKKHFKNSRVSSNLHYK